MWTLPSKRMWLVEYRRFLCRALTAGLLVVVMNLLKWVMRWAVSLLNHKGAHFPLAVTENSANEKCWVFYSDTEKKQQELLWQTLGHCVAPRWICCLALSLHLLSPSPGTGRVWPRMLERERNQPISGTVYGAEGVMRVAQVWHWPVCSL